MGERLIAPRGEGLYSQPLPGCPLLVLPGVGELGENSAIGGLQSPHFSVLHGAVGIADKETGLGIQAVAVEQLGAERARALVDLEGIERRVALGIRVDQDQIGRAHV